MIWIFPIAWAVFTGFKTEQDASSQTSPRSLFFHRYSDVSRSTMGTLALRTAFTNSLVVMLVSTTS